MPELILRKSFHRLGYRFRLHDSTLPGKPDLVFNKYKAVIFAHGCFWHGHGCFLFKWPSTRKVFWRNKISDNKSRDAKVLKQILDKGFRVLIVWECTIKKTSEKKLAAIIKKICLFLTGEQRYKKIENIR